MDGESPFSIQAQLAQQAILRYLLDLFTSAGRESFSREDVLVILNLCKNDPEIFDEEAILAEEAVVNAEE